ncbi:ribbon-helix-helix protein, CopG family [Edwardsiella tarda]
MAIQKKPQAIVTTDSVVEKFINAAPDGQSKKGVIKGKKQQITITMEPSLIEQIDAAAAENGQSRAAFINMSCINALENGVQIGGRKKHQN